ncbi:hypothetical protein [Streptosporangium sp. NBC_01756]|uniref:hypothetical protein n=1 Tax=Streptosporangium sp. NBC_01756 TaxID=2975950 RepID=UPI002DD7FA66|nr:hypothetical protein [Streptosporangium sp. NBC_01756]WSC86468.1 hypothetical protein OIE48_40005 [Streptosporangium sp. NBC_01756]
MARRKANDELNAVESLNISLQTLTIFHGYVQQADAKLATAATVHLGFTAVAVAQAGDLSKAWMSGPPMAVAAVILVLLFGAGCLIAGSQLIAALRPRLAGPAGPNRFGLVRADGVPSPAGAARQQREAWSLISTLADIALRKHERIRRSLPWMALMAVTTVAWLALTALTG